MVISERRYAAELIDYQGDIYKFDDIACLLRFAHSRRIEPSEAKFYVTDNASGSEWIDATQAHFVRMRTGVSSPMASGIVAYRDSAKGSGQKEDLLTFNELWARDMSETASSAAENNPK